MVSVHHALFANGSLKRYSNSLWIPSLSTRHSRGLLYKQLYSIQCLVSERSPLDQYQVPHQRLRMRSLGEANNNICVLFNILFEWLFSRWSLSYLGSNVDSNTITSRSLFVNRLFVLISQFN